MEKKYNYAREFQPETVFHKVCLVYKRFTYVTCRWQVNADNIESSSQIVQ